MAGTATAHYANGNGGQYIVVVPEPELVAVFTGENYNSPASQLRRIALLA